MNLLDSICKRRTYYALSNETTISNAKIQELIEAALCHTPSAFNMQSARIVLAIGKQHERVWEQTQEALKKIVPKKQLPATTEKINSFKAAYGTVLFFDDDQVIGKMKEQYPLYTENFDVWASQANGMLQSNIWMLLEEAGLGASLQHYNPLIDDRIRGLWDLPHHWRLVAQMPFGVPVEQPGEKTFVSIKERMKVYVD